MKKSRWDYICMLADIGKEKQKILRIQEENFAKKKIRYHGDEPIVYRCRKCKVEINRGNYLCHECKKEELLFDS